MPPALDTSLSASDDFATVHSALQSTCSADDNTAAVPGRG